MIEFFEWMLIVTGGLFCCAFWILLLIFGFIEVVDNLTESKPKRQLTLEDEL